jgi:hypothetical protein
MDRVTLIGRDRTILEVTDGHPPPASSTPDDPLEQGESLARGAAVLRIGRRPVLIEPPLVLLELVPGEISGMMAGDEERPVLGPDPPGPALDPRLLAGQAQQAGLGAAIDVGARILGVVQDLQDTAVAQRSPDQLTVAGTTPEPGGALELMARAEADCSNDSKISRMACWTCSSGSKTIRPSGS